MTSLTAYYSCEDTNPYYSTGRTSFIHGGSSMMFVAESYIVAVVNAVIALGFILMADAPKDPNNLNAKCG